MYLSYLIIRFHLQHVCDTQQGYTIDDSNYVETMKHIFYPPLMSQKTLNDLKIIKIFKLTMHVASSKQSMLTRPRTTENYVTYFKASPRDISKLDFSCIMARPHINHIVTVYYEMLLISNDCHFVIISLIFMITQNYFIEIMRRKF